MAVRIYLYSCNSLGGVKQKRQFLDNRQFKMGIRGVSTICG